MHPEWLRNWGLQVLDDTASPSVDDPRVGPAWATLRSIAWSEAERWEAPCPP
jgi:hypothetical protein